jgi:hypothetical protein
MRKLPRRAESWTSAAVVRTAIVTFLVGAAGILIAERMVNRMWGQPLLNEVGSRGMPLWLAWFVLAVDLVICVVFLRLGCGYLYRVARGRIPRRGSDRP